MSIFEYILVYFVVTQTDYRVFIKACLYTELSYSRVLNFSSSPLLLDSSRTLDFISKILVFPKIQIIYPSP